MWYMNEDRELIRNAAREFAEKEIKPFVSEMEFKDTYPRHLVKRMGELGFTGIPYPESYGGGGSDWTTFGIVVEEIAKVSTTVSLILLLNTCMTAIPIAELGTHEQKLKWLQPCLAGDYNLAIAITEAVGIFNFPEFQTRAVLDGDEWVINGGKIFTSSAGESDFYVLVTLTSDFDPATGSGITYFIVPAAAPGFEVGHIENKLGWHGSKTGQTYFRNIRLPQENQIGEVDGGYPATLKWAAFECLGFGSMCLGSAEAAYEKAVKYTKERIQMGKSLYDTHQVVRNQLAKIYMEIETLRGLTYSTWAMVDKGIDCMAQMYAVKVKAAQIQEYVTSEAMVLLGGNGVVRENDIERHFRDAKVNAIGGGSVNTLTDLISSMI